MCSVAYRILVQFLISNHRDNKALAEVIGSDRKGWLSMVLYIAGIALAFVHPWLGFGMYFSVAVIWFLPDRRIENRLLHEERTN
jgi:uncharacterized membrane protein